VLNNVIGASRASDHTCTDLGLHARSARVRLVALVLASTLLLTACSDDEEAAAAAPAQPPAPVVKSLVIEPRSLPNRIELTGRVAPFRISEVRARTDGLVREVAYEEGSQVEEGDLLFRIDSRIVQAAADEAEARLESARAQAANARTGADRVERLIDQNAISRQAYDDAIEASEAADAAVVQAEATLESARVSLGFAEVKAPIPGRAGRALVREGSLVSAAQATPLVTLRRTDQVYVNLAESATDLLAIRDRIRSGDIRVADESNVAVELLDDDGTALDLAGRIDFYDQTVDERTGTVTLRAVFPNPDGQLLPGQLVDTAILAGERPDAIAVPQPAVLLAAQGAAVMVVQDGTVSRRPVTLGPMVDGDWLIEDGLQAGDEIVLDNLQTLSDGASVRLARLQDETTEPEAMPAPTAER